VTHAFPGTNDGANPNAAVSSDAAGALYGTTVSGGGPYNNGTVFKLSPPSTPGGAWTETILYSFGGGNDGVNPYGGLIFDESGARYGTTYIGGVSYSARHVLMMYSPSPSRAA